LRGVLASVVAEVSVAPIPPAIEQEASTRPDFRTPWIPDKFGYDRRALTVRLVFADPGAQVGEYTGSPHYAQEQQGHG